MNGVDVPLTSEQQMNKFRLRDKMSLLNTEFLTVIKHYHQENPYYDFSSTMRSYMDHVKELKMMYKIGDVATETGTNNGSDEAPSKSKVPEKIVSPKKADAPTVAQEVSGFQRRIIKAARRNTPADGSASLKKTDSPAVSAVFAASSPATTTKAPMFGDISVIAKETPVAIAKKVEEPVQQTARKRAIRGGGPLGGSESVVFKKGGEEQKSKNDAPAVNIPLPTIKFPEPSKSFWTKPGGSDGKKIAPNEGGSLFGFLGKTETTSKFTGFSFGKKSDEKNDSTTEKKEDTPITSSNSENASSPPKPALSFPSFGKSPETAEDKPKSTLSFPSFGAKSDDKPALSFPSFGASAATGDKKDGESSKPALSFPSFGSTSGTSLFGSGASKSEASSSTTLSFGSTGGASLFSNLTQKAAENANAPSNADGDDNEGEYVPPKVETVENDEPDAIMTNKVSVFKFTGSEYKKLGVGMMYIKNTDEKHSVLIRAATATGAVWLNSLCNAAMKATKANGENGDKIRITCPVTATDMQTMLIRFATPEAANKFNEKIGELTK